MTIENSLERIANALEKMVEIAEKPCTCADVQETPKKKSSKKKAESVEAVAVSTETTPIEAELIQESVKEAATAVASSVDDLLGATPAEPKAALTLDDVRAAFTGFIKAAADQTTGVQQAKAILTKYGYTLVPEVKPEHFEAIINELQVK